MRVPWTDQTGLAKAITLVTTVLLIALGLCGANFVSVLLFAGDFISEDPNHKASVATRILSATGYAELITIGVCLVLLLFLILVGIVRLIVRRGD